MGELRSGPLMAEGIEHSVVETRQAARLRAHFLTACHLLTHDRVEAHATHCPGSDPRAVPPGREPALMIPLSVPAFR